MRILLILLFILFYSIHSLDNPSNPTLPKTPETKSGEETDPRGEKKQSPISKFRKIELFLCDGRSLSGEIEFKKDEIAIKHLRDGISYAKKVKAADLQAISILSWMPEKVRKKSDGTLYRIIPHRVQLLSKSNEKFLIYGLEDVGLLHLQINNKNGATTVYSYWMDLLNSDGKWYTNIISDTGKESQACFKDVMKQIYFYN